jgi:iron complex transport system ATP-binding protein
MLGTRGLSVSIADNEVCHDLELLIQEGSVWAILGRNGVGKTTLLKCLAGLHPPHQGEVLLEGLPLDSWTHRERARRIGVLFQHRTNTFPGTALETALTGRHPWVDRWSWEGEDDLALARAALAEVDLAGMEARAVSTLSGGESQRLGLATVLTQSPSLYLLDEPNNHLDLRHQIAVMELICRRAREPGHAAVLVLHDVNLAARFCDHALLLHGNGVSEHGAVEEVMTADSLSRLYQHPIRMVSDAGRYFIPA